MSEHIFDKHQQGQKLMRYRMIDQLVVNVDLKLVPALTFDIRITWCTD